MPTSVDFKVFFKKFLLISQTNLPDLIKAFGLTSIYVCLCHGNLQWSDVKSPSVSFPTLCIHTPFVYVHESYMSACELFVILHP